MYHHTAPISSVYALRSALAVIAKEGVDESVHRHKENAKFLYATLKEHGLECFVEKEKWRLPCLTTVKIPEGVDWKGVIEEMRNQGTENVPEGQAIQDDVRSLLVPKFWLLIIAGPTVLAIALLAVVFTAFALPPVDLKARAPLPDLGAHQWSCDPAVMAKSKEVPKSVHSVRFADIKMIAALGDSLSAGNGANAYGPLAVLKEYRGLAFPIGGDMTLEEHITIPNVLKKFNPNLFGYSTGVGKWNSWEVSKLNMAVPGSEAKDMPVQAQRLVDTMRKHP
ncbi:hypothetical protein GCK32_013661, partial [Trichostrongylus colubriformis]